jgi:hypothetical protein
MSETPKVTHRMVGGLPEKLQGPPQPFVPKLEQAASQSLCNISDEEAARRMVITKRLGLATFLVSALFVIAGSRVPRVARVLIAVPLSGFIGLGVSAQAKVCGISYQGKWDPDGSGLRPVPSQKLADEIWAKAKKMYASEAVAILGITWAFINSPL